MQGLRNAVEIVVEQVGVRVAGHRGADDLRALPDVGSSAAAEVFDFGEAKQRAKIDELNAENGMRQSFFRWSSKLTAWIIAANVIIFAGCLAIQAVAPGKLPDSVMFSWIAATVVETLGVVAIIARHAQGETSVERPSSPPALPELHLGGVDTQGACRSRFCVVPLAHQQDG